MLGAALTPARQRTRVAFVFGSFADGTERRDSDVDLMVIGDLSFSEVVSLIGPAQAILGREINPVVFPPAEFREKARGDHHFVNTVLEGPKIFVIGDEGELARLAEKRAAQTFRMA